MYDESEGGVSSRCDHFSFVGGVLTCDLDIGGYVANDLAFSEVFDFTEGFVFGAEAPVHPNSDFISLAEVRTVRQGLKKGIGSVSINNDHIRKFDCIAIDKIFSFVFNLFFLRGYWPLLWRQATIFPWINGAIL